MLQKLASCRLRPNTLWTSYQSADSSESSNTVRSTLLRSAIAHLYELHQLLTSVLGLSTSCPSIVASYVPHRRISTGGVEDELKGLPEGVQVGRIGGRHSSHEEERDVAMLVMRCLTLVGQEIGATRFTVV